jgi:hypothetical protein
VTRQCETRGEEFNVEYPITALVDDRTEESVSQKWHADGNYTRTLSMDGRTLTSGLRSLGKSEANNVIV